MSTPATDTTRAVSPAAHAWPRISVVGAGGVGCYFGGMLALAGAPVVFVARPNHAEAMRTRGLVIEHADRTDTIVVNASDDVAIAAGSSLVLLCTKTTSVVETAQSLVPHLAPNATVLCLQNGVDSAERVRAATGLDALPVVVYIAAEMVGDGHVRKGGRGALITGEPDADATAARRHVLPLAELATLFKGAGISFTVSANIQGDLWQKMVANCTYNAISAIARVRYGRIHANPHSESIVRPLADECIAVARALGITLPDIDLHEFGRKLTQVHAPEAYSSTAQDLMRGRRTEIDSLNGYIVRKGAEHGVPVPLNQALHALVKLQEEAIAAPPPHP